MAEFRSHPPVSDWDNYVDFESTSWPKKERRNYWIIPSICFNCESGCGVLAYVDKDTLDVRKIEGNPLHPGSRGRTCAKGVVTPNQLEDPDRILYPVKRVGKRGGGEWARVTWDEVLEDIGGRIRKAILEGRRREVMYHVGRPGEDERVGPALAARPLLHERVQVRPRPEPALSARVERPRRRLLVAVFRPRRAQAGDGCGELAVAVASLKFAVKSRRLRVAGEADAPHLLSEQRRPRRSSTKRSSGPH